MRPCPWISCRHHLLLEVASGKLGRDLRATSLRLNAPRSGRGRRPGLASSAAEALVHVWIDDALEQLQRMPYTCTFDVVADYPDGLPPSLLAPILGVSVHAIDKETRAARRHAAGVLRAGQVRDIAGAEPSVGIE